MTILDYQKRLQREAEFFKKHPEWRAIVLAAVNEWGKEQRTLNHAIGEALAAAHEMGVQGIKPEPPEPEPEETSSRARVVRRRAR